MYYITRLINFFMARVHRSIARRARKIDANRIANEADDYLCWHSAYKRDLEGVTGLVGVVRVKASVKRIDDLEKEVMKLEDKIERLMEKRAIEAVKLEQYLGENREILEDYLEPEELAEM